MQTVETGMLRELFTLTVPLAELVIRGSAIYWFVFLIFRFVMRRDVGAIGIADVLMLVLIADAAQNGMAGEYKSVTDAFVLVGTLVFWNFLLDWLSFHVPIVRRFTEAGVLCLVRDGRIIDRNLRREFISREELLGQLRAKGIEDISQVKRAYLESDGAFSVIRRERHGGDEDASRRHKAIGR